MASRRDRVQAALGALCFLAALVLLARSSLLAAAAPGTGGSLPAYVATSPLLLDALRTVSGVGTAVSTWVAVAAATMFLVLRGQVGPALFVVATGLGAAILAPAAGPVAHAAPGLEPVQAAVLPLSGPDGHALRSLATAGALLLTFRPVTPGRARLAVGAAAAALVVVVGVTQVVLGAGTVAGVAAGWLLALLWVAVAVVAFRLGGGRFPAAEDGTRPPEEVRGPALRAALPRLATGWVLLLAVLTAVGLLVITVLADTALVATDREVVRRLVAERSSAATAVLSFADTLSGTPAILGSALLAAAVTLGRQDRRALRFLAVALLGETSLAVSTSLLVGRPRPAVAHLEALPATSSFPSGHVAVAICWYGALAVLIGRRAPGWRLPAAALAVLVAAATAVSRVYLGVHYPSDVLAGVLLGTVWLAVTRRALLAGGDRGDLQAGHGAGEAGRRYRTVQGIPSTGGRRRASGAVADGLRLAVLVSGVAVLVQGQVEGGLRFLGAFLLLLVPRRLQVPRPFDAAFGAAILVAVWAHVARWYQAAWWVDDAIHLVLPGATAALLVLALARLDLLPRLDEGVFRRHRAPIVIITVTTGFAVAGLWEMYEWVAVRLLPGTSILVGYTDTVGDIALGGLGSVAAGFLLVVWARSGHGAGPLAREADRTL